jgi:hypothetical protein
MCDYSTKLVAWLDRELGDDQMAELERHVENCGDCLGQLRQYERVSKSFNAYCEAVMLAKVQRAGLPRVLAFCGAAVATLAAGVVLLLLPHRVELPVPPAPVVARRTSALEAVPAPRRSGVVHRRHAVPRAQEQSADWPPAKPRIEIAIPAESMFPPGAVPEGVNFHRGRERFTGWFGATDSLAAATDWV